MRQVKSTGRKIIHLIGIFFVAGMVLVAGMGCSRDVPIVENTGQGTSAAAKTYFSIINLQKTSAEKGIEAVSRYVDLPEQTARSAAGGELMDFEDIGLYLPSDLSTLTRVVPSGRFAAGETVVSLDSELQAIGEEFTKTLETLLPDPTDALSLPFVEGTEEGLKLEDDTIIPYASLEGAMTVEILNAMARGEDTEALVCDLESEIEAAFGTSRGVVKVGDGRWANGKVNYRWGNMSNAHKEAVRVAMDTWTNATGGRVYFSELPNTGWNNFQVTIHAIGVVNISDEEMTGANGLAHVGYGGGNRVLKLRKDLSGTTALKRTPLHELGHVLGLYHEHQRYNRDEYLIINESDAVNYGKIPKEISGWRLEWKRIKIGWWTISIPHFKLRSATNSYTTGTFDFKSIMLYSDVFVRDDKRHLNQGSAWTFYNTELSPYDIAMVKIIY